jgi:hypothetical protein
MNTSSTALGLSRAGEFASFGLVSPSPKKVNHILEGYGGTLGKSVNETVTHLAQATGLERRAGASEGLSLAVGAVRLQA